MNFIFDYLRGIRSQRIFQHEFRESVERRDVRNSERLTLRRSNVCDETQNSEERRGQFVSLVRRRHVERGGQERPEGVFYFTVLELGQGRLYSLTSRS